MAKVLMTARSFLWDGGPERIAPGAEFSVANDKEADRLEAAGVAERVAKPAPKKAGKDAESEAPAAE